MFHFDQETIDALAEAPKDKDNANDLRYYAAARGTRMILACHVNRAFTLTAVNGCLMALCVKAGLRKSTIVERKDQRGRVIGTNASVKWVDGTESVRAMKSQIAACAKLGKLQDVKDIGVLRTVIAKVSDETLIAKFVNADLRNVSPEVKVQLLALLDKVSMLATSTPLATRIATEREVMAEKVAMLTDTDTDTERDAA